MNIDRYWQHWGEYISLPRARFLNKLARGILFFLDRDILLKVYLKLRLGKQFTLHIALDDKFICKLIYLNLICGRQPKLLSFTARFEGYWHRGPNYYPLMSDNLKTGIYEEAHFFGMVVPYRVLRLYLRAKGWHGVCFSEKTIVDFEDRLEFLGFTGISAGFVVFLPVRDTF